MCSCKELNLYQLQGRNLDASSLREIGVSSRFWCKVIAVWWVIGVDLSRTRISGKE